MLIDFSVTNYRSIKDETTLSMVASPPKVETNELIIDLEKEKFKVLPLAIMYGSNASGKSNLIRAIRTFCSLIYTSDNIKIDEPIRYYNPFKLCKETRKQPTSFECEFILKGLRYRYIVHYDLMEILVEELYVYPEGREASLYKRAKGKSMTFGAYLKGPKKSIESTLLPNTLFLSRGANQSSNEQLKAVYRFFRDDFRIHTRMDSNSTPFHDTTEQIDKDKTFKKRVLNLLSSADLNINGINIKRNDNALDTLGLPDDMPDFLKKQIIDGMSKVPRIEHNVFSETGDIIDIIDFDLEDEESGGTVKMYDLASKILNTLDDGTTLFIDEFDSGLHPLLNQHIINLFQDPSFNPNKAQLIVATHDTCIMDLPNIRRDQIWFVNKNSTGETELFSLNEFSKNQVRKGTPFSKWYLDGRFRAIPSLKKNVDLHQTGDDNA